MLAQTTLTGNRTTVNTETDTHANGREPTGLVGYAPRYPMVCACACRFVGRWGRDFGSVNPTEERYREREQAAENYDEERSARTNRINAPPGHALKCPKCGEWGDSVRRVEGPVRRYDQ